MDYLFLSSVTLLALSMCFTPGPSNTICMATGLSRGFKAALPFCIGSGLGANVSLLLLGFGLGTAFERHPLLYELLRYGGAVYLLWLAWKISGIRPPRRGKGRSGGEAAPGDPADQAGAAPGGARPFTFWQAFVYPLVNVKVWVTNVIIVSNYVATGEDARLRLWFCVLFFTCMGTAAMCSWAAGGAFMRRFLSSEGIRRANYFFGASLVLAVALLFVEA